MITKGDNGGNKTEIEQEFFSKNVIDGKQRKSHWRNQEIRSDKY